MHTGRPMLHRLVLRAKVESYSTHPELSSFCSRSGSIRRLDGMSSEGKECCVCVKVFICMTVSLSHKSDVGDEQPAPSPALV
jgi:hypothetical protein